MWTGLLEVGANRTGRRGSLEGELELLVQLSPTSRLPASALTPSSSVHSDVVSGGAIHRPGPRERSCRWVSCFLLDIKT